MLLANILLHGLLSISASSFLSIEPAIYKVDGADTFHYEKGVYWQLNTNTGSGMRQLSTCFASGIAVSGSGGFAEFSFGIPFYDYGTTCLPFADFKAGAGSNRLAAYAGYTTPIVAREKEKRWGYEIYIEQVSACHSCYSGIVFERERNGKVLHCDVSLRREYNSYAEYKLGYYYQDREILTVKESYWHSALVLKLSLRRGMVTQTIYLSVDQRHIAEGISFNFGLGMAFGKAPIVSEKLEILTVRSNHFPIRPD